MGRMSTTVDVMARGRPRGFDADRALEEAMALFWRRGYRAVTTRDLEATLGLSQSSISNAFGAKADLLAAAVARYQERFAAEVLGALAAGPGLDAVDDFLDRLAAWLSADGVRGCLVSRLMSEGGLEAEAPARAVAAHRSQVRGALASALRRAADAGDMPAEGLGERTALLSGAVLGMNLTAVAGGTADEVAAIAAGARAEVAAWRRAARPTAAGAG